MWTFISGLAASVAVIIAYLQWKTAQTKVVLEIHATRYAIYQDLREAVTMFLQELKFSTEVQRKYLDAQSRARFHFGAEEMVQDIADLRDQNRSRNERIPPNEGADAALIVPPGPHLLSSFNSNSERPSAISILCHR
jgi:hypothetical protein